MKFNILVAQRRCSYSGEYAPEALEVADEYTIEENPEWLEGEKEKHDMNGEFDALAIMVVYVPDDFVTEALYPPKQPPVDGEVVK